MNASCMTCLLFVADKLIDEWVSESKNSYKGTPGNIKPQIDTIWHKITTKSHHTTTHLQWLQSSIRLHMQNDPKVTKIPEKKAKVTK